MKNHLHIISFFLLFLSLHTQLTFKQALINQITAQAPTIFSAFTSTTPGCSVSVIYQNQQIYLNGFGSQNLALQQKWSTSTPTSVASVSKILTGLSLAILVQQGLVNENDDIRKFFPTQLPNYPGTILVRHLAAHTSGLVEYFNLYNSSQGQLNNDLLWKIFQAGGSTLLFNPGDQELYTNTNYWLIGEIVRTVYNTTLRNWANANIFVPLQMNSTFYDDGTTSKPSNLARGYKSDGMGGYAIWEPDDTIVGDGAITTNHDDFFRFDKNYYNSTLYGGADTIARSVTRWKLNNGNNVDYGYGIGVQYSDISGFTNVLTHFHEGEYTGYRTEYVRFPTENFSTVIFCNGDYIAPATYSNQLIGIYFNLKKTGVHSLAVKTEGVVGIVFMCFVLWCLGLF